MANMVTRTIRTTRAVVAGADFTTNSVVEYEVNLTGTYKDEKAVLKAVLKKTDENSLVKPVRVKSYEVVDTLYGMDEEVFLANARILPPRKVNENKTNENN